MTVIVALASLGYFGHLHHNVNLQDSGSTAEFNHSMPKQFRQDELIGELAHRLTGDELRLAIDPLASTLEMKDFARTVTASASDDSIRARLLFDELVHHLERNGPLGYGEVRTAPQAFAALKTPGTSLYCKDYGFLYVSLARDIGLMACDVYVMDEENGQWAPHNCAAIVLQGKIVIVDPAWRVFGAKHRRFTLLDDMQATALYLSELPDLRSSEIACKLAPGLDLVQLNLIEKLVAAKRVREARKAAAVFEWLNTDAAAGYYVRGLLALAEGKPDRAIPVLSKATELRPDEATYHSALASAYAREGRLQEACEEGERGLRCAVTSEEAALMRQTINNAREYMKRSRDGGAVMSIPGE